MVLKHPSSFGDGFSFLFKNRSGAGMMAQWPTAHSTFVEECTHIRQLKTSCHSLSEGRIPLAPWALTITRKHTYACAHSQFKNLFKNVFQGLVN